jgi:transposase
MKYTPNRWVALTRYVVDSRLPLDTNAVENAISTAKLNGIEPMTYLTDILERLPTARMKDLEAMLPWNWAPQSAVIDIATELAKPPTPLVLTPV